MPFMKIFNAKGIEPVVDEPNGEKPPRIVEEVLPYGRKKTLEVTIEDVRYQVGRAGTVSIILNFKPVNIGRLRLSYIGLRGREDIQHREIFIGDRAVISIKPHHTFRLIDIKPGDDRNYNNQITEPGDCPECGSPLQVTDNFLICNNHDTCKGQLFEKFRFFTGFKGLQMESMRLSLLKTLIDEGDLCHYDDLFKLDEAVLLSTFTTMTVAESSWVVEDIRKSRDKPLAQLIMALGIHKVYRGNAELLANHFQDFNGFISADATQLRTALGDEVSKGVCDSILDYLERYAFELAELDCEILDEATDEDQSIDIKSLLSDTNISFIGKSISLQDIKRHLEQTGVEIVD